MLGHYAAIVAHPAGWGNSWVTRALTDARDARLVEAGDSRDDIQDIAAFFGLSNRRVTLAATHHNEA
jgi:hypothetical protein